MGSITKSGLPFLYDSVTGRITGVKNSDNSEFNLTITPVDSSGSIPAIVSVKWADRPLNPVINQQIILLDFSMSQWYWDGVSWRPSGGMAKLKASYGSNATPLITLTGNGTDFGVDLFTIPAGLIPKNSAVRISIMAKRLNGATALSNLNVRMGPTGVIGDQTIASAIVAASGGYSYGGSQIQFDANGTAARQNYQLSQGSGTSTSMAVVATDLTAIDRSVAQKIKLWMTSDWVAGNDVTIYSVEVDIYSTNIPASLLQVNSRIVMEGDSITAGTVGPQYSWFVQAMTKAFYFMPNGWNQGTGGESTVQMKAQTAAVNALSPSVVCFLGGTNDLQYFTTTAAEIFANIQSCINDYLSATAKYVVISTILPRNNTWILPAPREAIRLELNILIRSLASDKIKVVDIAASFNPTSDTTDGLHPNWLGAKKLGDAFTSILLSIQPVSDQGSLYALPENICGANALAGTTGAKTGNFNTGVVAAGWIAEAADGINVVCSKVVENGVEKQKFVFSGNALANNDGLRFRRAYTTNVATNQLVDYMLEVSMSGFSGVRLITASANTAVTPSSDQFGQMDITLNAELMRPPQKSLSSPITEIYQYFTIVFNAGPISGSLIIGKPYLKVIPLS